MTARKKQDEKQMSFGFDLDPESQDDAMSKKTTSPQKTAKTKKINARKKAPEDMEVEAETSSEPIEQTVKKKRRGQTVAATAESMAAKQRDISVSEFFAKNRHLLGFDNPRKALLTAVKEAVDNSLDACEEAHILPDITITIEPIEKTDNKFRLTVKDNGPGIVAKQVPNIFARLLYGSKFHTLKMSRGQQGIGISAAGMYGLLTTGEPVQIITRTKKASARHYHVQIDTTKNRPEVMSDEECEFDLATGTSVTITLEGKYLKGKQSVDEYIAQTAMANPHATVIYHAPGGETNEYLRQSNELPFIPAEIKPHPYGVELGVLFKMARECGRSTLADFLRSDFSRVSPRLGAEIVKKAKILSRTKPQKITLKEAERLHEAINSTKIMAPPTDCIGPIGEDKMIEGLARVVEADFYTSCTRKPSVYRGNPFIVEAALAFGCKEPSGSKKGDDEKESLVRLVRFANRVPLLYQQSACATHKAVLDTNWRNYGLSQSRGALPSGPMMLMVHIASVWVPFTSESKEAVAHYPEIIKELKLAIQECGRKLGMHVRKQKRIKDELVKRGYIETYLPHISQALKDILTLKDSQIDTLEVNLKNILERTRTLP